MIRKLVVIFLVSLCLACSGQDDEYIPYRLKGMNAWVSDENGNSYYAGLLEGGYSKREELKDECADLAYELAYSKNIENFDMSVVQLPLTLTVKQKSDNQNPFLEGGGFKDHNLPYMFTLCLEFRDSRHFEIITKTRSKYLSTGYA